jgi:eukaryotic-like serine/threonine-protein kinase
VRLKSPVAVGDLIVEKYRVERVLGQGGMGVVVAALHEQLGQRVAIKFLLPSIGESSPILARFEREARAAVALHSEHITRVLDVGRLSSGSPYMVMEMLEGTDLAQELRTRGRLPAHEAAAHVIQACDAFAEAHALGIVHRDIKPANLFLARRPKRASILKVLDFGISKASTLAEGAADITHTAELIGSPLYMSPEQLRASKTVDARSDIWSLGATLYELVSGVPPFDGTTMAVLSANILMTPLTDVRARAPGAEIPEALAVVLARCLEKDPANRYPSAEALALALAPIAKVETVVAAAQGSLPAPSFVQGGQTLPLLPGPSTPPLAAEAAPTPPAPARSERELQAVSEAAVSYPPPALAKPSQRVLLVVGAVVVAACATLGVFAMTRRADRTPSGPAVSASLASSPPTSPPSSVALTTPDPAPALVTASAAPAPASASPPATLAAAGTVRAPVRPAPSPVAMTSSTASSRPAPPASVAPKGSASPLNLKLE